MNVWDFFFYELSLHLMTFFNLGALLLLEIWFNFEVRKIHLKKLYWSSHLSKSDKMVYTREKVWLSVCCELSTARPRKNREKNKTFTAFSVNEKPLVLCNCTQCNSILCHFGFLHVRVLVDAPNMWPCKEHSHQQEIGGQNLSHLMMLETFWGNYAFFHPGCGTFILYQSFSCH